MLELAGAFVFKDVTSFPESASASLMLQPEACQLGNILQVSSAGFETTVSESSIK